MIGKLTKGSSHAGALRYDNQKKGAEFLETNCSSDDHNKIAVEMETVAASNTRCKNNCIHLSMSAPDGERLSDEQWKQAGRIARREIGLESNQFSMTRHTDSKQDHVHITINRINENGKAWNDSKDFQRVHAAMRVVEKEMGLQRMEDHQINRDGRFEQTKNDLNDSLKAACGKGLNHFKSEMKNRGYSIIENKSQSTGKISGISIKSDSDGKVWKASELRKGGYRGMEKQLNEQQKPGKEQQHKGNKNNSAAGRAIANSIKRTGVATPKLPSIPTSAGGAAKKILATAITAANTSIKRARSFER